MHHSETPDQSPGMRDRLATRFDALTRRLGGVLPLPSTVPGNSTNASDFAGQVAPAFALADLDGEHVTLEALLSPAKPLLLIFTDPRSSTCHDFMPDIAGWQRVYADRLAIAVISTGDPGTNRAMTAEYGIQPVLLQQGLEVVDAYGLLQAPVVVLVRPDGRIGAEPQYGPPAIRQLVADTLGLVMPPAPVLDIHAVGRGEPAPRIRHPDLDGNLFDLATFLGEPILLLFWSPGCGYCQELLPHLLAFEQAEIRLPLVVISGGSVAVNRDLGFISPIVLDDNRDVAQAFGVLGTPAAVLIGARGNVASDVARGAVAVRAYVDRCHVAIISPPLDGAPPS